MLKTTSKKYIERLHRFIIDRIEFEDAPYKISDRQKAEYLLATCKQEAGGCSQAVLTEWLTGLPSCINIPFANHEIIELTEWLHGHELSEEQADKVMDNYWSHMAFHILKIHRKLTLNQ